MPYSTVAELPDSTDSLPEGAKKIYLAAFNSAYEQYADREDREPAAHATAWTAVKNKYKKEGENWVQKESGLRPLLGELVQEYGRRNAAADAKRIHQIIDLCNELLDSEDEDKTEEAMTKAKEAIETLRTYPLVKHEEGHKYPPEAYAHTPDLSEPQTWTMRLWESPTEKVTRGQLQKAAASLSSGGYKGVKAQIPLEEVATVKRRLREEYRILGTADEDLPRWIREDAEGQSELGRALIDDFIPLTEASISKGVATLTVIRPGFNKSKERYYPDKMLARDYRMFEGVKMYADHPTEKEEDERPERSVRDWVATLRNVRLGNDGEILGEAVVLEPWLKERLSTLRDNGMLTDIGVSINAVGTASKGEIEGVKTNIIERIVRARSVDFVTEPGAGGGVAIYESEGLDVDLIGLETLRERRPDLVKELESALTGQIKKEVRKTMELETRVQELETGNAELVAENEQLKTRIEEADKAEARAAVKDKLNEALTASDLPEAAQSRIREMFADSETEDGIAGAIDKEKAYIAALSEGKVEKLGGSQTKVADSKESLKRAFMDGGMTEEQAEIAAQGR